MPASSALSSTQLGTVRRELALAGVTALVLSEPAGVPSAELLIARGQAHAADRALDRARWNWRVGGDGPWRLAGRRRYTFDGGYVLTVHHTLPAGPLPAAALRSLRRELWRTSSPSENGLRRCLSEPLLVYLAVQAARGLIQSSGQLAELRAHADRVTHWKNVWALSGALGVDDTLRAMLADHPRAAALSTRPSVLGSICAFGWRVTRELRNVRRVPVARDALLGEPWRGAVTRCRFGGVELLAGPRVFLPRKVSEPMVGVAVERLANVDRPVVVDVGTGCGAIALALARRIPAAHVLGFDMDPTAVTWARRNGFRLELPHVQFATGSLLDSLPASLHGRVDLVGANVPCLPPGSFAGAADAPNEAYVGSDPDGLGLQRRLAEQARRVLKPGGWLLVQLAPSQWPAYAEVVNGLGYRTEAPRADEIAVITAVQAP